MSSQPPQGNVTTRKKRRGMIEKRRRDKINNSLYELRRLVPAAFEKQGSAKLEKAEILQMTVDYLRMLHARGLAGSLTSAKQIPELHARSEELAQPQTQDVQPNVPQQHQPQQLAPTADAGLPQLQHQPSQVLDQHQQLLQPTGHQSQPIVTTPPMAGGHPQAASPPSLHSSSSSLVGLTTPNSTHSQNLYNQHQQMSAVYHNHLGSTVDMMSHANVHQNHAASQHQASLKHHNLKMDHHQQSLAVMQHPSLLNLDHHHHQPHHHHSSLSAHYGSHHHHHNTGASLAMNPYLAAAAVHAYPSITAVGATQLPVSSIDALQGQTSIGSYDQHQVLHNHHQQLTGSGSPPAADSNGHQQVSSSSSPTEQATNTSNSTQPRHYRPWGTELAY